MTRAIRGVGQRVPHGDHYCYLLNAADFFLRS